MKTPFMNIDAISMIKELGELSAKIIKGAETLTEIDDIDVGTTPKDIVFTEDKLKLWHYRPIGETTCKVPVLIVYALVNREYMLDLQPDRSIVRNLLQRGIDIYMIEWGYPTKTDMYLSLNDYINEYLNDCVDFIREKTQKDKINLMGICQGGTFSAMYAALYSEKVKNLITLVAPFDFSTNDGLLFRWAKHMNGDRSLEAYRIIPGSFLNLGFLMLMPLTLNISKYMDMLDTAQDKEKLLNFLRMEKWIFDSPGQAGTCFREFIRECYQDNKLIKNELEVGGKLVNLKNVTMPLLNIYASADHLVPPSSTKPFNDLVGSTDKSLYEFKGGHIGVFVGSKSQKELAPAISKWLHERADGESEKKPLVNPAKPGNKKASPMSDSSRRKVLKTKKSATSARLNKKQAAEKGKK
ncbi:MAG: class III poly(R)-hydroxyalkanoic acid synthase subunit PhaC [Dissulfurispiraceae bacterium]